MALNPSKILDTFGALRKVARHFDTSTVSAASRFLKLYCFERYSRTEIFALGIADPRTPAAEMAKLASEIRAHRLQCAINPERYAYVTEDKAVFHHFCLGAGIRMPRLHAVIDPTQIWTPDGRRLRRGENWERLFQQDLPETFVVKPTVGVHGQSVRVLTRDGDRFREVSGALLSAGDLLGALREDPQFDRFVVEQRIENHPSLAELSETEALQTTRIITGVDDAGEPAILIALQKLIGGANTADNFRFGRKGNLVAELSIDGGEIVQAVTGDASGLALAAVETHPTSGRRLIGFRIPDWEPLCALVLEAARKLMPIRTIGWDIAASPDGPLVIEANIFWSPDHANALRQTGRFLDYCGRVTTTTKLRQDL